MQEEDLEGLKLAATLQKRIDDNKYEFYFSSREIEGANVIESRYYYFVDVALMYHDKQERHRFLPVTGVMDQLDSIEPISKIVRPLYLDHVEYDFDSDSVSWGGFSKPSLQVLLDIFWSETNLDLCKHPEILIKKIDKTQFLDLSEASFMIAPIIITEE